MFYREADTFANTRSGVELLVIIASRVFLATLAPAAVAVQVRGTRERTTTERSVIREQSDELRNAPSNAQILAPDFDFALLCHVVPRGFHGGKPDIAGPKKSKVRRDD